MNIEVINSITIIHPGRTILQSDSDELRKLFEDLYNKKTNTIIMNLLDTDHICSSALGHMVFMRNRVQENFGDVKLVVQDEDLLELMDITMLNLVFEIYSSIGSALEAFEKK
ncbi:MAG: STAS domain-containing protein [Leptospiraceae bacterium]|nr:STAS domain-containing protein [Leptospiraceae bacterium]